MLYKSAYSDLQVLVRSSTVMYHPATGVEVGRVKPLTASFGSHGGTFFSKDTLTGQEVEHAIIHGHYFDTESAAERLEWTTEERESVEAALDKMCREQPFLVGKVELATPVAEKPWPTFDEMNAKEIVLFAKQLGLVDQALAYERDNKARSTLIAELEEELAEKAAPQPAVAITL